MTEPAPSQPDVPSTTPETSPKPRRWPWIAAAPVALLLGVGVGFALQPEPEKVEVPTAATAHEKTRMSEQARQLDGRQEALDDREAELDDRADELDTRADDVEQQEAALDERLETVRQNTVTTGTWTVGEDIESGIYRALDVSADCYWEITEAGSNGSDILNNGIPGGGNPSVTLSKGQVFTTQRCGEWHKQE